MSLVFFTIVYKHMSIFTSHLELESDRRTVETSFSFSVNKFVRKTSVIEVGGRGVCGNGKK